MVGADLDSSFQYGCLREKDRRRKEDIGNDVRWMCTYVGIEGWPDGVQETPLHLVDRSREAYAGSEISSMICSKTVQSFASLAEKAELLHGRFDSAILLIAIADHTGTTLQLHFLETGFCQELQKAYLNVT